MERHLIDPANPTIESFVANIKEENFKRVVLAGPMSANPEEINKLLAPGLPILFIDGGIKFLEEMPPPMRARLGPTLTLGDGDSAPEGKQQLDLVYPSKKAISDLGLGLEILHLLNPPPGTIHLLGFLGGERGHEWCGILEVIRWLDSKSQCLAHFSQTITICSPGTHNLHHKGPFTVCSFKENQSSLSGAIQFPLDNQHSLLPMSTHGLNNCAAGSFTWQSDQVGLFFWGSP